MKRFFKRLFYVLALLLLINIAYVYLKPEGVKNYIYNKDLKIIKESWLGNLRFGDEFANAETKDKPVMPTDIFKWKVLSKNPQAKEKKEDTFRLKVVKNTDFITSKEDMIVWLGHATFFIRINGKTLLTDPILGDIPMVKRLSDFACKADDLKQIDYILLSHGHRDHFDKTTLTTIIKNNPDVEALVPMGLTSFFEKKGVKTQEAAWFQQYSIAEDFNIFFMPAKHWNRRALLDFNKELWGSFVIQSETNSIFFAGDTAYGEHFEEVAQFFPEIDYCLLPVGAYKPDYIMKESHMSPTEALQAFQDMKAKIFIPMHYATFDLSDEPIGEPVRILEKEQDQHHIKFLNIGELLTIE